jgi:hypothetical protein
MERGIVLQEAGQGVWCMVALMLQVQERVVLRLENIVQSLDMEIELRQFGRERPDDAWDWEMEMRGKRIGQKLSFVFKQAIQGMGGDPEAAGCLSPAPAGLSGIALPAWGWVAATSSHAEEKSFPNMYH